MPKLQLPLPINGIITSKFGYRKPPKKGASTMHQGVDISAPISTPVKAPLDGTVVMASLAGDAGNKLILKHEEGFYTEYLHLSKFNVDTGQNVVTGQTIAFTGNTGNSTGPHLHYAMKINGVYVDPLANSSNLPVEKLEPSTAHASLTQPKVQNFKEYIQVISNDNIETNDVIKFIGKYNIQMSAAELMNFKDNKAQIVKAYTKKQFTSTGGSASEHILNVGTSLKVPLHKIKSNSPYKVNQNLLIDKSYNTFIEGEIRKLIFDKNYRKVEKLNIDNSETTQGVGTFYKRINTLSVWLWSKAASLEGNYLIDITPFVKTVNTTVNINGGNFSIRLPHINYKRDQKSFEFDIPIIHYNGQDGLNYRSFVSKNVTHHIEQVPTRFECDHFDDDELNQNQYHYRRNGSFFNDLIQSNDVIFIRFEKLMVDSAKYDDNIDFQKISPTELKGRVFDMIGLVDMCKQSMDAENHVEVNITGRDLSKMLIDDGVNFFPVEYAVKNSEQIIKNSSKTKSAKRIVIPASKDTNGNYEQNVKYTLNGQILGDNRFNFDLTQTVGEWLLFIFSQLTNIDICPDNLFSSYSDKTFIVSRNDNYSENGSFDYKRILANGLWQITKLVTDPSISDRRIADASLSTDTGSLLNLVRKVCQNPFAEFSMDTYGDKYYFMLRKPPFTEQAFRTNKCINVYDADIINDDLDFSDEVYSWFRLTPMGSIIDVSDGNMMIELPAVLLPEYLEVWGMKTLDIQTNYLDFDMSIGTETQSNLQNILKQGEDDLDWLIESHAYLPFTRTGTITLKGDRRIKRGMNIRHFATGEVFHVDAVSNIANLTDTTERLTTLTVSHGIVEKHFGKYFNIVNLKRNGRTSETWSVNQDIFKFFLQRKQFIV